MPREVILNELFVAVLPILVQIGSAADRGENLQTAGAIAESLQEKGATSRRPSVAAVGR